MVFSNFLLLLKLKFKISGTYIPPDVRAQREKKRQDNRKRREDEAKKKQESNLRENNVEIIAELAQ